MCRKMYHMILLALMFNFATSLRILAVFPTVTRSHYSPGRRIMMELLEKGHEIVSISPFAEDKDLVNFTWVPVEVKFFFDAVPNLREEISIQYNFFSYQFYVWRTMNAYAKYIVNRPILRDFIEHDTSRFDLVLSEEFFLPVFFAFSYKYNAPLVIVTAYGVAQYINEYIENPMELTLSTHEFLQFTKPRNIYERALNFICTIFDIIGRRLVLVEYQDNLAREVFKNVPNLPHLGDLERSVDLVLVNSHFSVMDVMPSLQNVVEIGGVHIEEVRLLGQDLQLVLDGATEGAILFSFGSILDINSQPEEFIKETLTALSELNQTIIMKWDSERNITGTYNNIYPYKWLPQNDILAHPNMVLFIMHGGLLSLYEAIYHQVPVVCIPFQASQPKNCRRADEMGIGVHLKVGNMTAATLKKAIKTVLNNPGYKTRIEVVSTIFRDRKEPPLVTAVNRIEHCARFCSVLKRKKEALKTAFFDYNLLDLALSLCVVLFVVLGIRKLVNITFCKA